MKTPTPKSQTAKDLVELAKTLGVSFKGVDKRIDLIEKRLSQVEDSPSRKGLVELYDECLAIATKDIPRGKTYTPDRLVSLSTFINYLRNRETEEVEANFVRVQYYCSECNERHFGNCPKIKTTLTTSSKPSESVANPPSEDLEYRIRRVLNILSPKSALHRKEVAVAQLLELMRGNK